jgi:xanthine dehydrogenase accessory factor
MIKGKLAEQVDQLRTERAPFVLATVVRARRPTSVRPGDTAIVLPDGTIDGFVGGVCAESSVRLYSLRVLETGEPLLLRLVPGEGEGSPSDAREGAVVEHNPCLSGGTLEIFLEPQLPAARMIVIGGSPIAEALEQVAGAAGYDVVRRTPSEAEDVDGAAAVIVAAHGNGEERVLERALSAGVPYVALVASPRRGAAVREALDVPEELVAQLHSPAGLDIGAQTPAEIAISILAELVSEQHADPAPGRPEIPAVATVAIDPVCGMQVAVADSSLHLDVGGERVFFCGEHCRRTYAEQHAPDAAPR